MKIKLEGEMTVEKALLAGMKFGEWTEVELEIVTERGDGVRLLFSGVHKSSFGRRDMAEIHIDDKGRVSMEKPVIRPNHDHDDQTNYCELRGVSMSWSGLGKGARTETVHSEAVTIVPLVVDY